MRRKLDPANAGVHPPKISPDEKTVSKRWRGAFAKFSGKNGARVLIREKQNLCETRGTSRPENNTTFGLKGKNVVNQGSRADRAYSRKATLCPAKLGTPGRFAENDSPRPNSHDPPKSFVSI